MILSSFNCLYSSSALCRMVFIKLVYVAIMFPFIHNVYVVTTGEDNEQ